MLFYILGFNKVKRKERKKKAVMFIFTHTAAETVGPPNNEEVKPVSTKHEV